MQLASSGFIKDLANYSLWSLDAFHWSIRTMNSFRKQKDCKSFLVARKSTCGFKNKREQKMRLKFRAFLTLKVGGVGNKT